MPVGEARQIPLFKRDQALSDCRTPVPVVRSSQTYPPQVTPHGAAEACVVPEKHASPPDIGRVDQEKQLIVLIYQIRGLVIIVHVPYSHFRSSELFKRRLEDFFFPAGKAPCRQGQVTGDRL